MVDGIDSAAVLLGIAGFRVLACVETEVGEVWILVETVAEVVGCPECGVRAPHRPEGWAIGFCDLDGALIEVIEGRSGTGISGYLRTQPQATRQRVEWVSIDPWQGYLRPVRRLLPNARIVVDHFHLIRLANQVVTEVRQRTQQQVTGHRGRKGDPLYGIRRLLLRGRERLEARHWARLQAAFDHPDGDRWDEVACAWIAKELLRDLYAAPTPREARRRLAVFYDWADQVAVVEVDRLARTVRRWETEILAYHHRRISNRPYRSRQPHRREAPQRRPRIPQLPELPAPSASPPRREMANSTHHQDQRPPTPNGRVEPVWDSRQGVDTASQ